MMPHFLDNQQTDGGEIVSITSRPHYTPQENSSHTFFLEAESFPGAMVRLEELGKLEKIQ
jgi:hypothetical protein